MAETDHPEFNVDPQTLGELLERKALLSEYNGIEPLVEHLQTSLSEGLPQDPAVLNKHKEYFGENFIAPKLAHSYFYYLFKATQDYMLLILLCGGILFFTVETIRNPGAVAMDGIAIMVSVFCVVLVVSINDYTKELKFKNLHKSIKLGNTCTVLRGGLVCEVNTVDLVVGDVYMPKYGDLVPADSVLFQSDNIRVEESAITGESDLVKKSADKNPYLLASTHIMDGTGRALVVATGHNSQTGRILRLLDATKKKSKKRKATLREEEKPETGDENTQKNRSMLQEKLNKLALMIGKMGFVSGFLVFGIRITRFCIQVYSGSGSRGFLVTDIWEYLDFLLEGFSVIIVAVPEGLPLAVTISLAYSVMKMLDDHNLVRQLYSCETMGNATTICSDKTGTLTMNRMTVLQVYVHGEKRTDLSQWPDLPPLLTNCLCANICFNKSPSSALKEPPVPGAPLTQLGNKTDCALLGFLAHLGTSFAKFVKDFDAEAVIKTFPFNSEKKIMTVVMRVDSGTWRVLVKGAPDVLLTKCDRTFEGGEVALLSPEVARNIEKVLSEMATEALRTLLLAYKDIPAQTDSELLEESVLTTNLVLLAFVGIEDPVRPDVPEAIRTCRRAGITVRMVTGDNLVTARSIALKCGILREDRSELIMDSSRFNKLVRNEDKTFSQEHFDRVWPSLRVLARSTPKDKYVLVNGIINTALPNKQIVAVTGDGTNDAPALKRADVGFAMGLTGTDIAKEACDIIITDDNFIHIIDAIKWGRNVNDSISKFIQFQLTVNVVAIFLSIITPLICNSSALTPIMFLWVNLIMDSFASLALATDPPTDDLLDRKPYSRNRGLLSKNMVMFILFHGLFQLLICLILVFLAPRLFSIDNSFSLHNFNTVNGLKDADTLHTTLIFNVFVFLQIFNQFNARKVHGERNVFVNIFKNKLFICIFLGTAITQVLIVQFTYTFFHVQPLSPELWMWSLFLASTELLYHQLVVVNLPHLISIPKRFRITEGIPSSSVVSYDTGGYDTRLLWIRGLHKLQQEMRVIDAFKQNLSVRNTTYDDDLHAKHTSLERNFNETPFDS